MSSDAVIDELHMKLYEACKLRNWNLIQTSPYAEGTRTFIVWTGNRRARVLVTDQKSARHPGDVTLTSDTLTANVGFIAAAIEGAMVQRTT
jgi:hypothetical protein